MDFSFQVSVLPRRLCSGDAGRRQGTAVRWPWVQPAFGQVAGVAPKTVIID